MFLPPAGFLGVFRPLNQVLDVLLVASRAGAWIETFQWHVRDYVKKSPPVGGHARKPTSPEK
jgi:hypothetical protein